MPRSTTSHVLQTVCRASFEARKAAENEQGHHKSAEPPKGARHDPRHAYDAAVRQREAVDGHEQRLVRFCSLCSCPGLYLHSAAAHRRQQAVLASLRAKGQHTNMGITSSGPLASLV